MKLFYSLNSPYARTARITAIETKLPQLDMVEVANRSPASPLLRFSPVCRVPTLVDRGLVIGESRNVYRYLREAAGTYEDATDWAERAYESIATGFLDGIAVWRRERRRTENLQSSSVTVVEEARAKRCLKWFDQQITRMERNPETWHFADITVACALDVMELNALLQGWREDHPALGRWLAEKSTRPSMIATRPRLKS